jgi:hypothetical protein
VGDPGDRLVVALVIVAFLLMLIGGVLLFVVSV